MWPNPQKTVDLVTFTEEILNGKLLFLSNGISSNQSLIFLSKKYWRIVKVRSIHPELFCKCSQNSPVS